MEYDICRYLESSLDIPLDYLVDSINPSCVLFIEQFIQEKKNVVIVSTAALIT